MSTMENWDKLGLVRGIAVRLINTYVFQCVYVYSYKISGFLYCSMAERKVLTRAVPMLY